MKKMSYNAFKKSFIELLRYELDQFNFKWEEVSGINEGLAKKIKEEI